MSNIGPMIAASARLSLGYAERLLKDVREQDFARFARVGSTIIESNHPSFIFGHLSLYAPRVIAELGGDASSVQPSDGFLAVYSKDASCVDDPEGTLYPPMGEVVDALMKSHQLAIETLESADDDLFLQPNGNEAMRGKFPTVGAMHGFYLGGHFMLHMGQMSAWRRAMGLGPA
ncbi:DinB family protein [Stieleria varia]|uniref:DinB superfamily protein n=1 Tax=Stieleria varia TaxID=2528005 RepID=A0A5C5ZUM9_9BACT|nr:DinB family protein [Stieleria varia]TWT91254.1 hypothetical protein Pla52n_66660 [Stieleria varia]